MNTALKWGSRRWPSWSSLSLGSTCCREPRCRWIRAGPDVDVDRDPCRDAGSHRCADADRVGIGQRGDHRIPEGPLLAGTYTLAPFAGPDCVPPTLAWCRDEPRADSILRHHGPRRMGRDRFRGLGVGEPGARWGRLGLRSGLVASHRSMQGPGSRMSLSDPRSPTSSTRSRRIPSSTRRRPSMSRLPATRGSTSTFRFRRTSPPRPKRTRADPTTVHGNPASTPRARPALAPVGPRRRRHSRRGPEHGLSRNLGEAPAPSSRRWWTRSRSSPDAGRSRRPYAVQRPDAGFVDSGEPTACPDRLDRRAG